MTNRVEIRTTNKWKSVKMETDLVDGFAKITVEQAAIRPPNIHEISDADDDDNDGHLDAQQHASVRPMSDYSDVRQLQLKFQTTRREPEKKFKNGTRMSLHFSNDRMREIERCNQILLKKILSRGPSARQSSAAVQSSGSAPASRVTSATINKRKQQLQIERDNEILLRKLQNIQRNNSRAQ